MTRGEFIQGLGATACFAATGFATAGDGEKLPDAYAALQANIDLVTPADFAAYRMGTDAPKLDALKALDAAFDKVVAEVKATTVTDRPAVWLVYNMGVVVKTKESCFTIDLNHRKAAAVADLFDFALITHNHGDHYTEAFYAAMNGARKTVVSNFRDNYGVKDWAKEGGYTHGNKTFILRDVEVRTHVTDHNGYLVDFTSAMEVKIGDFVLLHTGDCSNIAKVNPACSAPDLWIVHPRCGTKVADGVAKFKPKKTVIAHLNELGHARDRWRWTWSDGFAEAAKAESAGSAAVVPLWGERIS